MEGGCLCLGFCGLVVSPPTHPPAVYAFLLPAGILRLALLLNRFSLSQQSQKKYLNSKMHVLVMGSNYSQPSELKTRIAKLSYLELH